jgi:hypothetical protein
MTAEEMSPSEHACCKRMRDKCGSIQMQHSCCRSSFEKSASQMQQPANRWTHPDLKVISIVIAMGRVHCRRPEVLFHLMTGSSPPLAPYPGIISVLRI